MIHVVAAVIQDSRGRVLLSRRPDHVHLGGLWEFPGGKLEPGEQAVMALARELSEELGIRVRSQRPLIQVRHSYAEKTVWLDVYRVDAFDGEPRGAEGQALSWVDKQALDPSMMPAADRPIISAIQLPEIYAFTPPAVASPNALMDGLEAMLRIGIRLVQFRLFGLAQDLHEHLLERAVSLCRARGAWLLSNGGIELAKRLGAEGVHLSAAQLHSVNARPEGFRWLGASCHNAAELARAREIDVDFVVLSPVLPTPSHPDARPLGWDRFGDLVRNTSIPVFALGGMTAEHIPQAQAAGGQGVAGIRGFWPEHGA